MNENAPSSKENQAFSLDYKEKEGLKLKENEKREEEKEKPES